MMTYMAWDSLLVFAMYASTHDFPKTDIVAHIHSPTGDRAYTPSSLRAHCSF